MLWRTTLSNRLSSSFSYFTDSLAILSSLSKNRGRGFLRPIAQILGSMLSEDEDFGPPAEGGEEAPSSASSRTEGGYDQASGSGNGSEPSALDQRKDELILGNLEKRKGSLADGQRISGVRRAVEGDFHTKSPGESFGLVKQLEKELDVTKTSPATNSAFNEVKDFQSHVQDKMDGAEANKSRHE